MIAFDDPPSGPVDASDDAGERGPARAGPVEHERYERLGVLGAGGMGRVYLARDRLLGRMVALKEAHDDALARRLAREVRVTAGLEHPGIVTLYDEARGSDGRLFYTMRLMRGRPLSQLLGERRTAAARLELLPHYLDACHALAYAHAHAVIHRDLKPANIMIGAYGETQVVDWGLARRLGDPSDHADADATCPGAVLGTPAYMSPEQARGEPADRRSDVWGLGAVLHELLSGAPPRPAVETMQVEPLAPATRALPRDVPLELRAIVARATALDASARYPDAGALAIDVAAFLAGRRVHAHRYSALEIGLRFARAWRVPLLVAGGALLVIATLVVLGTLRLQAQRDRALAAEDEARAALAASDRNLAAALVAQARAADERGAHAVKEVLATHALRLVDSPEARGILAGARAAARPERLATAALPDCFPLVALAVDDVVCAENDTLRRLVAGAELWRVTLPKPVKELRVDGARLLVDRPRLRAHHAVVRHRRAKGRGVGHRRLQRRRGLARARRIPGRRPGAAAPRQRVRRDPPGRRVRARRRPPRPAVRRRPARPVLGDRRAGPRPDPRSRRVHHLHPARADERRPASRRRRRAGPGRGRRSGHTRDLDGRADPPEPGAADCGRAGRRPRRGRARARRRRAVRPARAAPARHDRGHRRPRRPPARGRQRPRRRRPRRHPLGPARLAAHRRPRRRARPVRGGVLARRSLARDHPRRGSGARVGSRDLVAETCPRDRHRHRQGQRLLARRRALRGRRRRRRPARPARVPPRQRGDAVAPARAAAGPMAGRSRPRRAPRPGVPIDGSSRRRAHRRRVDVRPLRPGLPRRRR
ncbi:serine/threonine-protein kinase [Nannocystis pusilla]|uniref:serine/threonine-protein kinase n=1 Tax=Nannocystis pusilla TaxID=889268 RepID=UPI003DA6107B